MSFVNRLLRAALGGGKGRPSDEEPPDRETVAERLRARLSGLSRRKARRHRSDEGGGSD